MLQAGPGTCLDTPNSVKALGPEHQALEPCTSRPYYEGPGPSLGSTASLLGVYMHAISLTCDLTMLS